jgi:hypothetical protein
LLKNPSPMVEPATTTPLQGSGPVSDWLSVPSDDPRIVKAIRKWNV